jgi:dTDP-4-amino-4,6-dideoxygalactose transaminase
MTSWKILLSPPEMSSAEREMLIQAFDSGWIAPAGPDLDAFEHELAEYTGAAAVAGLSSGTAALHLALMAVGVQAGDDVLLPTTTFAAPAFATTYLNARPCFIDIDETWQLDADLLAAELQRRAAIKALPAAVVAVNLYGSVANLGQISEICQAFDVPLVEDGAESLGATLDGRSAGRFGRIGVLSFNGNKIVTTGGGGAVISDDEALVSRCRFLATQARVPVVRYEHEEVGYNYRLGNLNAAVGRGQLATLPDRLRQRGQVNAQYRSALSVQPAISFQPELPTCRPNHWLTAIVIDPEHRPNGVGEVLGALGQAGIEARPGFMPMHRQPVFRDAPMVGGDKADRNFATSVCLPSSGRLTSSEVSWVCDIVLSTLS